MVVSLMKKTHKQFCKPINKVNYSHMVTYNSDTAFIVGYILLSTNIAYVWSSFWSGGARDAITSYYYE